MLRHAVPEAFAAAGVDPAARHRHRHRLHRLHDAADHRRRHPAVRAVRVDRPAARLRQAVEAPRRAAPGRPDQRAGPRARRAVARPLRRQDLLGVGVRQGPAAARGGPGGLRRHRALDRGGRLDHLAALRDATSATPAPPATRASTRTGAIPTGTSWPRSTRTSPTSCRQARPPDRRSWAPAAGRLTRRGGRLDRAAGGHRGRGRQRGRARDRAGRATPSRPASWSRSWAPRPATS